jgi:4-amino-4-deoxy-L-arabinose transferase-like glycosyltransferase
MQSGEGERLTSPYAQSRGVGRHAKTLLLVLLFASSMVGLSGRLLSAHDEARYAEVAREMLESGDWLTPRLSGIEHWHKPPVTYWAIAASFAAFGVNEFAARLPSALAAVASIIAVYGTGRMLFGRRAGLLGAVVLASSLLFLLMGRLATPDMLLTCWTCWAVHFLVRAFVHPDTPRTNALLRGVFIGLGFMTKGPVIFLFVVAPALGAVALTRRWRTFRAAKPWLAAVAFCVVGLPWFVVVCVQNPGLAGYFAGFQTFARVVSDVHNRTASVLYYVPVLLLGFGPWIVFVPYAAARALRAKGERADDVKARGLLMLLLFVVPIVVLSVIRSKGLAYMLPALPAGALLVGWLLDKEMRQAGKWRVGFAADAWAGVTAMACFIAWLLVVFFVREGYPALKALERHVLLFTVLVGVGAFAVVAALLRRVRWLLVTGFAAPVPLCVLVMLATMPDMSSHVSWEASGKRMADVIAPRLNEGDRLVFYRSVSHATSFYLRARPIHVACDVDVRFMEAKEYAGWVFEGDPVDALKGVFERAEDSGARLFCTAQRDDYRALVETPGAPRTYELAERHRTVLFSNRPDRDGGARSVRDGLPPAEQAAE